MELFIDDMAKPNGQTVSNPAAFGNSWVIQTSSDKVTRFLEEFTCIPSC